MTKPVYVDPVTIKLGILRAVFRARHPADAHEFDKLAKKLEETPSRTWTAGDRTGTIEATVVDFLG